jgi:hypothetical protein
MAEKVECGVSHPSDQCPEGPFRMHLCSKKIEVKQAPLGKRVKAPHNGPHKCKYCPKTW